MKHPAAMVFKKGDGSMHERLNCLYNDLKHTEDRIAAAQMPPGDTVPVWMENEGLSGVKVKLSYAETAQVLSELAVFADALMNPKTAKDTLRKSLIEGNQPAA